MSSEQQNKNQVGGGRRAQTALENTVQIAPEGTAQTQASATADGAAGSPDGTNGGNDRDSTNSINGENDRDSTNSRNDGNDKNSINSINSINDGNGKNGKDSKTDRHDTNDTNVNSGKKRGKLIGLLAAAAVLIAAVIGIGIYNAPSNRMNRALDLGARYLEEQNYEQALVEFDKVIAIDPMSVDAYLGKAQAYEGMGDTEQQLAVLQTGYEQTGDVQIKEQLVDAYLEQASGFAASGDYESALAVYDKLLELDGENPEVQNGLRTLLLQQASDYEASGNYDGALAVYDRLLEMDGENPEVQKGIGDLLNSYLRKLIDEGNYDEARALIEKYRDKVSGVDFQAYLNEIEEMERIKAENAAFLQKVFDLMAAQDYEAVRELYTSEETAAFVERMEQDSLVYVPENDAAQTGKGAGVYRYYYDEENNGYYFYYGDLADGSREGEGCSFAIDTSENSNGGYYVFTGHWENDAPNGEGMLELSSSRFRNGNDGYQGYTKSGSLIDGLFDGPVTYQLFAFGYTYDLSFTAVRGVAQEDVTEEYENQTGYQEDLEEGEKITAFDEGAGYVVYQVCDADDLYGAIGYGH